MDMKAFRADLQQKSFNARKTNNYEDRINVTYKGMVSENSEEHYKTLSENLEKSVSFLSGLLRAAEYQSINVGIQNALRGRSNLYEASAPPVTPAPPGPTNWDGTVPQPKGPYGFTVPQAPASNPPTGGPPSNPSPGDTYTTPQGTTLVWENGRWRVVTYTPTTPTTPKPAPGTPAPAPAPQAPAPQAPAPQAPTPAPTPAPAPAPAPGPRNPNNPPPNDPNDPLQPGVTFTGKDGTKWIWNGTKWKIVSSPPTPRRPETPRKGGGYYPRGS